MARMKKQHNQVSNARAKPAQLGDGERVVAHQPPATQHGVAAEIVLYVVGGSGGGAARNAALRDFPILQRDEGESAVSHLVRVVRLVEAVMAAGGTHLLVPRKEANWLADHPLVIDYFTDYHDLAEASATVGIVFALRPADPVQLTSQVGGTKPSNQHLDLDSSANEVSNQEASNQVASARSDIQLAASDDNGRTLQSNCRREAPEDTELWIPVWQHGEDAHRP
jgi:hypothetical protein